MTHWEGLRFRLYGRDENGELVGIAEAPDTASLGLALVTIAEENRLAGYPAEQVGVLDWHAHRWLTSPFITRKQTPFQ